MGVDSPDELIGGDSLEWIVEEDQGMVRERTLGRQRGEPQPELYEFTLRRANGELRRVEASVALIDYQGKPASLAYVRDVTDQKRVVKELRESEERFRALSEASSEAIAIHDEDTILESNQAFVEMFGYSLSEVIGMNVLDLAAPESRNLVERNIGSGNKGPYVAVGLRKDGSTFIGEVRGRALPYGGETVRVAAIRDISERVKYRERLEALHRHAAELSSIQSLPQISDATLTAMETALGYKYVAFLAVEDDGLHTLGVRGAPLLDIPLPLNGRGITMKSVREGRSILVNNLWEDPDFVGGSTDSLSELAVPVLVEGKAEAVLNVESVSLDAFTDDDRRLLEALASHVASAIRGIRMWDKKRRYRNRLEALHGVAVQMSEAETSHEIYGIAFSAMTETLSYRRCSILVVEGNMLVDRFLTGYMEEAMHRLPLEGRGLTVRAVRTGETVHVSDVSADPDYIEAAVGVDVGSEIVVPIKAEGEVVAVLNVERRGVNAFAGGDVVLLETLAMHVSAAVSGLKQVERLKAYEERYRTFLEASMDAVFVNDSTRYLYVNRRGAELLGFSDPSERVGREFVEFFAPGERETVARRARGRLRGEEHPTRYDVEMRKRDGTPITVEVNVNVIEYEGKPTVLAVIRDMTERKRFEVRLEALHGYVQRLAATTRVEEVMDVTLRFVDQTLGFEQATFGVIQDDIIHLGGFTGADTRMRGVFPLGKGVIGRAVRTGETQLVHDTRKNGDFVPGSAAGVYKALSELVVPVKVDGEVTAVINLESNVPDAFTKGDRALLETLATHVSSSLVRLRQVDDISRQENRLVALHDSALRLAKARSIEKVMDVTMDAMRRSLGFEVASYLAVEDGHLVTVALEGAEMLGLRLPLDGAGVTVRAARTGEPILISDTRLEPDYVEGSIQALSELAVPVKVTDRVMAVLNVESDRVNAYDVDDRRLLETLAHHVSSALDRLERVGSLERLVEERTGELLDAERMTAAGRVAAMVAHDLRGPLQTIKNTVYLLRKSPENTGKVVEMLDRAVDRASGLLEGFRSSTREEPLRIVITDLAALIQLAVGETSIPEHVEVRLQIGECL